MKMQGFAPLTLMLAIVPFTGCGGSSSGSSSQNSGLAAGGASTIYVVQQGTAGSSILQFAVTATGIASPTGTLTTPSGTTVEAVATDSSGQIYVGVITSTSVGEVLVYPAGSTGAAVPSRTIIGAASSATTFTRPYSMAVGANGVLYVLSPSTVSSINPYSVTGFSSSANGAATPLIYLAGSQTQMAGTLGLAVDSASNVYVSGLYANISGAVSGAIEVFASGANGNAAPSRVITAASVFYGIAVDANLNIYTVEDSASANAAGSIVEFGAGASGAATPVKTIAGSATTFYFGGGVRLDGAGNLYVVNAVSPQTSAVQTVLGFAPTATGNVAPSVNFSSAAWSSGGSELAIK